MKTKKAMKSLSTKALKSVVGGLALQEATQMESRKLRSSSLCDNEAITEMTIAY